LRKTNVEVALRLCETNRMSDQGKADFSLEKFPCFYTFKIIGRNTDTFAERVREVVGRTLGPVPLDSVKTRDSAGAKYRSVTIVIYVASRDLLEKVYGDLRAEEDVLLFL